ncbi:MAG: cytochrome c3 family protein [Desulfobacteraceae bacterium]|nr:cytochrome c3 family protein [Desulfobacteraceae bacterium]
MNMKKKKLLLISLAMVISLLLWGVGIGYAAISGVCSNCHTMHNSQNNDGEVETYATGSLTTGVDTPQNQLLKASCIACHTGSTSATNSHDAPIVIHTTDPVTQGAGKTLAGGDFRWVATGLGATDSKGHNVAGINSADVAIGTTPPGWDTAATPGALSDGSIAGGAASWGANQLTCAGMYGCHGSHSVTDADSAISGAHHGNTGGTSRQVSSAPGSVGASYRFLGGIWGLENSQWNWAETASVHNEYCGVNGNTSYANKTTISYSCAQCHGIFHKTTGTPSPWTRHPTDITLPSTGEYASYTTYSVEAPVARSTVPATSSSTVTPSGTTNDIVTCISCHRAHGSPEPDLLRWTYSGMVAGTGTSDTGCFTCHTTKNAS